MALTIVDRFRENVQHRADRPALRRFSGDRWESLTWSEYGRAVDEASGGLVDLGVQPGETVGILSWNRVEWPVVDLAIMSIGAISVPVYPTNTPGQVRHVLGHSEARVCFVEDEAQLAKVSAVRDDLPKLDRVILISGGTLGHDPWVVPFDELRARGIRVMALDPERVTRRAEALRADSLATIVYTSGTTGAPRGAMITHGNIEATVEALLQIVDLNEDDRFLSFLPLSHIAERVTSHFMQITEGGETWFARSIGTIAEDLVACRPTIFLAVPRVWQKFHAKIEETLAGERGISSALARRFVALGLKRVSAVADGRSMSRRDRIAFAILNPVVGPRIRHRLGLNRARVLVSSAAPIQRSLVEYFHALGLPIAEVYGQTEDCGPSTMNPPRRIRIGTVGQPLPNLTLRIAEDGEIEVRGPTVCLGYYKDPVATSELLSEGWMHTGDLGAIDADGYVTITGRKKDLIINAAGKNISPQELEGRLAAEPLISQAVAVGEGRRYLTAILTLDRDQVFAWARSHDKIGDVSDLVDDPDLRVAIGAAVDRVNEEYAPVERIRKWTVLPRDFTQEADELTPTLKVRRAAILAKHADLVESLYGPDGFDRG